MLWLPTRYKSPSLSPKCHPRNSAGLPGSVSGRPCHRFFSEKIGSRTPCHGCRPDCAASRRPFRRQKLNRTASRRTCHHHKLNSNASRLPGRRQKGSSALSDFRAVNRTAICLLAGLQTNDSKRRSVPAGFPGSCGLHYFSLTDRSPVVPNLIWDPNRSLDDLARKRTCMDPCFRRDDRQVLIFCPFLLICNTLESRDDRICTSHYAELNPYQKRLLPYGNSLFIVAPLGVEPRTF